MIREKNTDPAKWNASKLHTMVAWFKRPGDGSILKWKEQLLHRYLLTCHHPKEEAKGKKDDELPVVDAIDAIDDAAADNLNEAEQDIAVTLLHIGATGV